MSFDLVRQVLDRSRFRGQPLHLLTLVFIADETMHRTGKPLATRKSLMADTGASDGRMREVLRDLMQSGEVVGTGGGRGNVATYALNVTVLSAQSCPRLFGADPKPAALAAGKDDKHAGAAAGLAFQQDANMLLGQQKHAARPRKHAARAAPSNKDQGITKEDQGGRARARMREDNSARNIAIAARAVAHVPPKKDVTAMVQKPEDVEQQTWEDWIALRKAKRAPITTTVLKGARAEAEKAGMTFDAFLSEWVMRGSQGLKAEWLTDHKGMRPRNGWGSSSPADEAVNVLPVFEPEPPPFTPEQAERFAKVKDEYGPNSGIGDGEYVAYQLWKRQGR